MQGTCDGMLFKQKKSPVAVYPHSVHSVLCHKMATDIIEICMHIHISHLIYKWITFDITFMVQLHLSHYLFTVCHWFYASFIFKHFCCTSELGCSPLCLTLLTFIWLITDYLSITSWCNYIMFFCFEIAAAVTEPSSPLVFICLHSCAACRRWSLRCRHRWRWNQMTEKELKGGTAIPDTCTHTHLVVQLPSSRYPGSYHPVFLFFPTNVLQQLWTCSLMLYGQHLQSVYKLVAERDCMPFMDFYHWQ